MFSSEGHSSSAMPGGFPDENPWCEVAPSDSPGEWASSSGRISDDDWELASPASVEEPASSVWHLPGAFKDDDHPWWKGVPRGSFEHLTLPRDLDGFEEYDEARWRMAPTDLDHIPRSRDSTQDKDIVIAVMGVTGAGKSTFIKTVSGRDDVIVGDSLSSETNEVHAYEFHHQGTNYILVDTPGFDDTKRNDSQITELILNWLKDSFLQGTKLNGVIHLHRISDPRMGGTALRNARMFRKLCGENAFQNVILATTFWETVAPATGTQREKELRENHDFWGGMLEKGAQMVRLQADRQSGLALLEQMAANGKVTLDVQDEMVNQGKDARDTDVLRAEREELERVQRELEAEREAARMQMEREQARAREEQELRLRQERERLRREREAERVAEERRQARERWEAQILYEKQLEEIKRERERQEEKMRRERVEMERRERDERRRQKAREEAAAAEVVRKRREYQDNYVCRGVRPQWSCDKCSGKVQRYTKYYHCCFCDSDRYFHCGACGNNCGQSTHPYMKERVSDDDCIVM